MKSEKPNCYKCSHRGEALGSCHSSCKHPDSGSGDAGGNIFAILASVGRCAPVGNHDGIKKLNISFHLQGIRHGWFNWPYNFDPVWLLTCDGFKAKAEGK